MKNSSKMLTKSKFLEYCQCSERLNKSLVNPGNIDETKRNVLQNGIQVGFLARELFGHGVEVGASTMYENNYKYLQTPGGVFFEAPFKTETLLARVDILTVLPNGELKISEVKSTTSFKESEHLPDIYFQKRVVEEATGLHVSAIELIHINNDYVFDGTWDANNFFSIVNVPIEETVQIQIYKKIDKCLAHLDEGFPDYAPGTHCKSPYTCPHFDECTKDLGTVLNLRRGGKKIWMFADSGLKNISDIKDVTDLSLFQLKQYESEKLNLPVIEKGGIQDFLSRISFPCSLLDFEGFSTPIVHNLGITNLKPYSQIIFQADLKIASSFKDEILKTTGIIADRKSDPRKQVADFLFENVPDSGSVVVYFKNYEVTRIEELAELYPQYRFKFNSIINRIVDLEEVFSRGLYVDHLFEGSSSIKKVLGIICPEMATAYKDLPIINNGQLASIKYFEYYSGLLSPSQEKQIIDSLDNYCSLDVLSMWKIIQKLRSICEK